ncbi:MAG: transporter substrate-binding domain-containing protein [Bradyrhizobium sp.]|nr:transporter substrate-binding domain-containing protein [Bradyrhizobium sp.]
MTPLQRIAGLCRGLVVPVILACVTLPGVADARPLDSIKNRGILLVCANPNALPFASKTGDRRGFELELGEALASQLGVKLEVGWVVFPNQLGRVDCDIVLDAIVDEASAHERHIRLSRPYLVSGVAIALRPGVSGVTDYADLKKGQRVGAMVGSLASVTLGQKGLPTIPYTFEDDMVEAVGKGELDAALATPASIGYYNLLHKDAPVTLVRAYQNQPEFRWEVAVGMRKSDDALVAAINEAIDRLLADGTISRIYAGYGIEPSLPKGP